MRILLTILLLSITNLLSGAKYYFANGGSDAAAGTSSGTAWQTASKFTTLLGTANTGDSILFNRGDTFIGFIVTSCNSGIAFGAYGTGAKPLFNGFTSLGTWTETSPGSHLWEASVNSGNNLDVVTVGGVTVPAGRSPNAGSYYNVDSYTNISGGSATITSTGIPAGTQSWNGAQAVIRVNQFNLDRKWITGHSSNTITYTSPDNPKNIQSNNQKFFIQKHPATLDVQNEWYYNPSTHVLRMYSTSNPSGLDVKAATQDYFYLVDFRNRIGFQNLSFKGMDSLVISCRFPILFNIWYNDMEDIGTDAIVFDTDSSCKVWYNNINRCGNSGIVHRASAHPWIEGNTVDSCGLIKGMGLGNNQQYDGIMVENDMGSGRVPGDSTIIIYNKVTNVGYCGIRWAGTNTQVYGNYVNGYGKTLSDGGGIYTNGMFGLANKRIVRDNLILNGVGNNDMMASSTNGGVPGIYLDDATGDVEISGNTIGSATRYGIFLHNDHEINVHGNTIYNTSGEAAIGIVHDDLEPLHPSRNIAVKYNIINNPSGLKLLDIYSYDDDDIDQLGVIDSNYYSRPAAGNIITYTAPSAGGDYSITSWRTAFGFDRFSTMTVVPTDSLRFEYNSLLTAATVNLSSTYVDLPSSFYTGNILLQPLKSYIWIKRVIQRYSLPFAIAPTSY